MTTSTIAPITAASSEIADTLAASAVGRPNGLSGRDAQPFAFERVLAHEAGSPAPDAASSSRDLDRDPAMRNAGARGSGGRPESPGATDPQPEHGRDDEHAVGRTRSRDRREPIETRPADGTPRADVSDAADAPADAPGGDPSAAEPGVGQTAAVVSPDATAAADEPVASPGTTDAVGAVAAGKGHRKPGETVKAADATDATVLAAVLTPALGSAQAGAGAAGTAATPDADRAPNAATPAIPATPATSAHASGDGTAVPAKPATPAVPAHASQPPAPASPAPTPIATTPITPPDPSPATTATPIPDAAGAPTAADAGQIAQATGADGASKPVVAPQASPAAPAGPGQPADATLVAAATAAATGPDAVAPARRDARSRGVGPAARSGDAAGREGSASVDRDAGLPATASDVARARASIARIVAAGPEDAVSARHHEAGSAGAAQGSVPAAGVVAGTPAADAALAAIAAARQGTPAASAPSSAAGTTPASSPAADRLAFEAIDRIRTTVTAGVPGLESRIDDPELGSIRIVVSARLGETIRAEIVARDPAAARELASGIDRALAAGAVLPANLDLRIRAEGASPTARSDAHLGQGSGEHGRPQDQPAPGGTLAGTGDGSTGSGAGSAPGRDADRSVPAHLSALAPVEGRALGVAPSSVAIASNPGALPPGTALDVRA